MNNKTLQRVFEIYKDNGFDPKTHDIGAAVVILKKIVGKDRLHEIFKEAKEYNEQYIDKVVEQYFAKSWKDKKALSEYSKVFKETEEYVIIPIYLINQMNHYYKDQINS